MDAVRPTLCCVVRFTLRSCVKCLWLLNNDEKVLCLLRRVMVMDVLVCMCVCVF